MQQYEAVPAPSKSLADLLREIPVGLSIWFSDAEHSKTSVRSTLTRVKRENPTWDFTSRPEDDGLRIWRLK